MFDFSSNLVSKALVVAGDMAATGAHTTAVQDLGAYLQAGQLLISAVTAGADTIGTMSLEDSADGVNFLPVAPAVTITDIAAGADGSLAQYNILTLRRYVQFKYTTAVAGASFLAVVIEAQLAKV